MEEEDVVAMRRAWIGELSGQEYSELETLNRKLLEAVCQTSQRLLFVQNNVFCLKVQKRALHFQKIACGAARARLRLALLAPLVGEQGASLPRAPPP